MVLDEGRQLLKKLRANLHGISLRLRKHLSHETCDDLLSSPFEVLFGDVGLLVTRLNGRGVNCCLKRHDGRLHNLHSWCLHDLHGWHLHLHLHLHRRSSLPPSRSEKRHRQPTRSRRRRKNLVSSLAAGE